MISMTQIAQTTSWGEKKTRLELWDEQLKDPIVSSVWRIRAGEFCWPKNLVEEAIPNG